MYQRADSFPNSPPFARPDVKSHFCSLANTNSCPNAVTIVAAHEQPHWFSDLSSNSTWSN